MGLTAIASAKTTFEDGDLKARLAKYHRDAENAFRGWNDAWLHPDFREWNVEEVIDYIRVPVLAIQGRQDQYGSLAQIEALENRCYAPVDRVILDECGHAPFLEHPLPVLSAITEYCRRLERIESA